MSKKLCALLALSCALWIQSNKTHAATVAAIDVNDGVAGPTEAGFVGVNGVEGSFVINGVTYTLFGGLDGTRDRGAPDLVTRDFTFNSGAGAGIGLRMSGLAAGTYDVRSWHYDDDFPTQGTVQIEIREQGGATIGGGPIVDSFAFSADAAEYKISVEAGKTYELVIREDDGFDRSRLNGIVLATQDAAYADTVEAASPLAYYRLNESIAAFGAVDETGNSPAGIYNGVTPNDSNVPAGGLGETNTSANFDGSGSNTLTGLTTGLTSDAGAVSYWINVDSSGSTTQTGVFARNAAGDGGFDGGTANELGTFTRSDGSLGIQIGNASADASPGLFTTDEWHHVAYTWDRNSGAGDGELHVYLDGVVVESNTAASWASFLLDDAARFGKQIFSGANRQLTGNADELAFFGSALSAEQVREQYNTAVNGEGTFASLARFDMNGDFATEGDTIASTQSTFVNTQNDANTGGSAVTTASHGAIGLTVTNNNNDEYRDRGILGPLVGNDHANLLRDFAFNRAGGADAVSDALQVKIDGLEANTEYVVRVYSFDRDGNANAGSVWFEGVPASLSTNDPSLLITHRNLADPDGGHFDVKLTTNGSGEIVLTGRGTNQFGGSILTFFNGVEVFEVPDLTDVILVDVNLTNTGQAGNQMDTKSGYIGLNPTNNTGSASANGVTVTVTSDRMDSPTRDRNNTGDSLLDDFIFATNELQIDIVGLIVGKQYELTIYSQDTNGNVNDFTDWFFNDDNAPFRNSHLNLGVSTTSRDQWSFTTFFTADASSLTVYGRGGTGSLVFLNGLELRMISIPAPAALPIGLVAFALLATRRKRR